MHVLVIGGAGTIGRFVVDELRERGHRATVFDQRAPDMNGFETDADEVPYIEGDITNADEVDSAVTDADTVIQLAALLPDACEADPRRAERVNVGGTLNVLESAADNGIRALCASSKAVFGSLAGDYAHPTYEPIGEDAPKAPTDVYGATKLACEHHCQAYTRTRDLDVACFRFASTYGPGKGDAHGAYALLPRMIERSARGESVSVSGADQRNDFIYYLDLAAGIADAVEADQLTYNVYHLGSGRAVPLRRFVDIVREHCPDSDIEMSGGLDFFEDDHRRYCRLDISRARTDLGYDPQYDPEAAVRDYLSRLP